MMLPKSIAKLRFKKDNGTEFPEWEEKTLGSLARFIVQNHEQHVHPQGKDVYS